MPKLAHPAQVLLWIVSAVGIVIAGFWTVFVYFDVGSTPARTKPQYLSIDTPPITEEWVFSFTELTIDYAEAEKAGQSITSFRVSYVRTPPFAANTPQFQWQLDAGPYDLDSPQGAFLVSRDGPRIPLIANAGSTGRLVYTVPPANQGDYLVAIVLLSSKATEIVGETLDIVTALVK